MINKMRDSYTPSNYNRGMYTREADMNHAINNDNYATIIRQNKQALK